MNTKYTFVVAAEITLNVTVSAASLEDAVAKAKAAPLTRLCDQCALGTSGEWRVGGEAELDTALEEAELVEAWQNDKIAVIDAAQEVWSDG